MGLFRRDRRDDVDVESCLANLHRIDELVPDRVLDLRDRAEVDLPADPEVRRRGAGLRATTPS
jgi:hypothetical protein